MLKLVGSLGTMRTGFLLTRLFDSGDLLFIFWHKEWTVFKQMSSDKQKGNSDIDLNPLWITFTFHQHQISVYESDILSIKTENKLDYWYQGYRVSRFLQFFT